MPITNHAAKFPRIDDAAARPERRTGRLLSAFVLLGAALGAVTAAAQTPPTGTRPIDTNNDGALDAQELRAAREVAFERADADGDGHLTPAESKAARMAGDIERLSRGLGVLGRRFGNAETADQFFMRLDADKDGRVSEREFLDAPNPLLRFDADGDARVTREEIEGGRKPLRRPPF